MSRTAEQIIHELAGINLQDFNKLEPACKSLNDIYGRSIPPHADTFYLIHSLILAARTAETAVERAPKHAGADDYAGVVQLAVVMTDDGRILTKRRSDAPGHAMAPLLGALAHEVGKLTRDAGRDSGLAKKDWEALVDKMGEEAANADFRRVALKVPSAVPDLTPPPLIETPGLVLPRVITPDQDANL